MYLVHHRRSQEFVLGGTMLDLSNFSWGRIEAPKALTGVHAVWERGVSPPHWGRLWTGGSAAILIFDLKMVDFGVFWRDKFKVFR